MSTWSAIKQFLAQFIAIDLKNFLGVYGFDTKFKINQNCRKVLQKICNGNLNLNFFGF